MRKWKDHLSCKIFHCLVSTGDGDVLISSFLHSQVGRVKLPLCELSKGTLVTHQAEGQGFLMDGVVNADISSA